MSSRYKSQICKSLIHMYVLNFTFLTLFPKNDLYFLLWGCYPKCHVRQWFSSLGVYSQPMGMFHTTLWPEPQSRNKGRSLSWAWALLEKSLERQNTKTPNSGKRTRRGLILMTSQGLNSSFQEFQHENEYQNGRQICILIVIFLH